MATREGPKRVNGSPRRPNLVAAVSSWVVVVLLSTAVASSSAQVAPPAATGPNAVEALLQKCQSRLQALVNLTDGATPSVTTSATLGGLSVSLNTAYARNVAPLFFLPQVATPVSDNADNFIASSACGAECDRTMCLCLGLNPSSSAASNPYAFPCEAPANAAACINRPSSRSTVSACLESFFICRMAAAKTTSRSQLDPPPSSPPVSSSTPAASSSVATTSLTVTATATPTTSLTLTAPPPSPAAELECRERRVSLYLAGLSAVAEVGLASRWPLSASYQACETFVCSTLTAGAQLFGSCNVAFVGSLGSLVPEQVCTANSILAPTTAAPATTATPAPPPRLPPPVEVPSALFFRSNDVLLRLQRNLTTVKDLSDFVSVLESYLDAQRSVVLSVGDPTTLSFSVIVNPTTMTGALWYLVTIAATGGNFVAEVDTSLIAAAASTASTGITTFAIPGSGGAVAVPTGAGSTTATVTITPLIFASSLAQRLSDAVNSRYSKPAVLQRYPFVVEQALGLKGVNADSLDGGTLGLGDVSRRKSIATQSEAPTGLPVWLTVVVVIICGLVGTGVGMFLSSTLLKAPVEAPLKERLMRHPTFAAVAPPQ